MPDASADLVSERLEEHLALAQALAEPSLAAQVAAVADVFVQVYRAGGQALFAGNGGSAALASHAAAEFVGRCTTEREALPALALTDAAVVTALGNDYGYADVFVRQVQAHGRAGDLFVGLSTSGRSPNVVKALAVARDRGLTTVALTGGAGGALLDAAADHVLVVPSSRTGPIQEAHGLWCHIWAEAVERALGAS